MTDTIHSIENGIPMVSTRPLDEARPRVVVVAPDVVGTRMAGPGIRFVRIAEQLVDVAEVTLAVGIAGSDTAAVSGRGFQVTTYSDVDELVDIVAAHDIAFCQLVDRDVIRRGSSAGCRFIFDLYNALPAEAIGAERIGGISTQPEKDRIFGDVLSYFRFCMRAGGYFVTSNERQRDFWMGYLLASEGLLPSELDGRSTAEIIGLVPFGMEEGEPLAHEHGIRGRFGITDDDVVLLWAGGIWDWFDAETPIRAVARLRQTRDDIHLVFYGTTHPNSLIGKPPAVERAQELASQLGVLGVGVHFIDGWVPADRRAEFLADSDIAISAHLDSFETRYAFRTRILDHFWASLPSIVTRGDWFAEYIDANHLGVVTDYGDVDGTAQAVLELADAKRRNEIRARVSSVREAWRWSATTADLRAVIGDWQSRLRLPELPTSPPAADQPRPSRDARAADATEQTAVSERVRSPFHSFFSRLRQRLAR
ncbi:glycosyltransferase [Microbacterium cremeum]|uniref:glycosyltransferase n=1 Tax=Microbacterium cremeum TaxID=2782169 RepID=UPI0018893BA6|nr:glycosyltransferase [Microbacterium cremeum]